MVKIRRAIPLLLVLSIGVGVALPAGAASASNKSLLTFTAKTVEGKSYNSNVLSNKKPTVIWFWAPWCAICKNESAFIVESAQQYKGKVNFLGVGALGSREEFADFITHTGTSIFTNLDDSKGKLWNRFGVVIQPTLVFVDAKGRVTTKVGPSDEEFLAKKLAALTAKQ
jgi:thiol-disulfide isomerase/thioredoxin